MTRSQATVKGLKTDLVLYQQMLRHENLVHKHLVRTHERERAVSHMKQATMAKNAFIQHSALVEASRRMPPEIARYYHEKIRDLATKRGIYAS